MANSYTTDITYYYRRNSVGKQFSLFTHSYSFYISRPISILVTVSVFISPLRKIYTGLSKIKQQAVKIYQPSFSATYCDEQLGKQYTHIHKLTVLPFKTHKHTQFKLKTKNEVKMNDTSI